MARKLLTADEFRAAAKNGGRPDGIVLRLAAGEPADVAGKPRTKRFVFSDGSVDRVGDTVDPAGWELDNFTRNSVALWAHDSFSPPIGRAANVGIAGAKLVGDIEFAPPETYAFADTIYRLVDGGYIKAVSVGFMPIEWSFANDKDRPWGIDYKRQDLYEISVCPVPCNANALIEARSKGIDTRPLKEWAERLLDTGSSILVPRGLLEETFRRAKTPLPVRQKYLAKSADWKCGAARDLPLDQGEEWDGAAAEASIFAHAGGDNFNPEVARKGFLAYDAAAPALRGSYKEPFAHVADGTLKAVKGGIKAAASRLPQAEIGDSARAEAQAVIDHYEKSFGMKARRPKRRALGEDGGGSDLVPDEDGGDGSDAPDGNCGRDADETCGMIDPQECAVHRVPVVDPKSKSGRKISAKNKALLEEAMDHHAQASACIKSVLDDDSGTNDVEPDADDGLAEDHVVADPDEARAARIAAARALRASLT